MGRQAVIDASYAAGGPLRHTLKGSLFRQAKHAVRRTTVWKYIHTDSHTYSTNTETSPGYTPTCAMLAKLCILWISTHFGFGSLKVCVCVCAFAPVTPIPCQWGMRDDLSIVRTDCLLSGSSEFLLGVLWSAWWIMNNNWQAGSDTQPSESALSVCELLSGRGVHFLPS